MGLEASEELTPYCVERLIKERTLAGLSAARARGRKGGRPPLDPYSRKVEAAEKLYRDTSNPIN